MARPGSVSDDQGKGRDGLAGLLSVADRRTKGVTASGWCRLVGLPSLVLWGLGTTGVLRAWE